MNERAMQAKVREFVRQYRGMTAEEVRTAILKGLPPIWRDEAARIRALTDVACARGVKLRVLPRLDAVARQVEGFAQELEHAEKQ